MVGAVTMREVLKCSFCGRVVVFSREPLQVGHEIPECEEYKRALSELEEKFALARGRPRVEWVGKDGRSVEMGEA